MRLTLRTLLAYLDDLLDRRDAEELETKIQSSPLASELVHRIRNTVGQIRLDSPPVDGQGMGGDPNTVSEYLDNTLPPERVPDFERVCLDSDVNLGEVASCHQVLTLVLGEPAEVSPAMRRRVYALGYEDDADASVLDEPHSAALGSTRLPVTSGIEDEASPPADAPEPAPASEERWKYPDHKPSYTAEKSLRVFPLAMTALAAFVLVFAGLRGLGPFDSTHPIAKMFGGNQVASNDGAEGSDDGIPVVYLGMDPNAEGTDETGTFVPNAESDADVAGASELELPPAGDETDPSFDDGTDALGGENGFVQDDSNAGQFADAGGFDTVTETGQEPFEPELPTHDPDEVNADVNELALTNPGNPIVPPEPRPLANPVENRIRDASTGEVNPVPTFPGNAGLVSDNVIDEGNEFADDRIDDPNLEVASAEQPFDPVLDGGPIEPEGPVELGQLLAEKSVVLRLNPNTDSWDRPSHGSPLVPGDEYLSLPVYRSQFAFSNGVDVTLVGATEVQLLPHQRNGVPRIHVKSGRIIVAPTGEQGLDIDLQVGGHDTQIIFDDANSVLAVEVRQEHPPGTDPTAGPPMTVVEAFATTGIVHWSEVGQEEIQITAGQRMAFVDDRPGTTSDAAAMPTWISPKRVKPINVRAARDLAPMITFDRPVVLSLQEQTDHRRPEIRSLTACSLAYLGDLRPLVTALNDERLKAYRTEQFETLRRVIASSEQAAAEVRDAFSMRHGDRTDEFFRILWGYSPSELQAGASTELVEHLLDESLDFRIVAIETLKQITGKSITTFGPEQSQNSRRKAYLHWSSDAKKNRIAYKSMPAILALTK